MVRAPEDVILGEYPIFSSLPRAEREKVSAASTVHTYRDGEFIFFEGDAGDRFFLLARGRVRILKQSPAGKEVILEILGPGDPVGAVAVLDGKPFPASAQAMGEAVVLALGKNRFLEAVDRYPAVTRDLFRFMRARLRSARETVPALTGDPVEQRIAATLLRLAEQAPGAPPDGPLVLPVVLTRSDIAKMIGSTVETVIRVMSKWEKNGILRSRRGHPLVILDRGKLRSLSSL